MSDLRMELIQGQLNDIEENVRSIKATWGNTIMTLDNIKTSLKADRQKAIDEAYQKGYDAAWVNVGECEDRVAKQAYQKGFEAGQHEATTLEYQQGLDEAWETIIKLAHTTYAQRSEIFDGQQDILSIVQKFSPSEAIAKLREYEQQKADEIKVGDEVCFVFAGGETIEPFIVLSIKDDNGKKYYEGIQVSDGRWVGGGLKYYKTGRHFPQVEELLEAIKGEDRSCSTCKYMDGSDMSKCSDCSFSKGYSEWELKIN